MDLMADRVLRISRCLGGNLITLLLFVTNLIFDAVSTLSVCGLNNPTNPSIVAKRRRRRLCDSVEMNPGRDIYSGSRNALRLSPNVGRVFLRPFLI